MACSVRPALVTSFPPREHMKQHIHLVHVIYTGQNPAETTQILGSCFQKRVKRAKITARKLSALNAGPWNQSQLHFWNQNSVQFWGQNNVHFCNQNDMQSWNQNEHLVSTMESKQPSNFRLQTCSFETKQLLISVRNHNWNS